jgi:hypothetical protein
MAKATKPRATHKKRGGADPAAIQLLRDEAQIKADAGEMEKANEMRSMADELERQALPLQDKIQSESMWPKFDGIPNANSSDVAGDIASGNAAEGNAAEGYAAEEAPATGGGSKRSFTVMSTTHKGVAPGGTYLSSAPMNAAKKAARQLFAKAHRAQKITFVLRETTRGSAKKTYKYVATKTKLSPPKKVTRGGVTIVLKHEYEVKAAK